VAHFAFDAGLAWRLGEGECGENAGCDGDEKECGFHRWLLYDEILPDARLFLAIVESMDINSPGFRRTFPKVVLWMCFAGLALVLVAVVLTMIGFNT
jgi:hypothetical protein